MQTEITNLLTSLELAPNTDAQGELLRGLVFDQSEGGLGCYTAFDTNPGFNKGDEQWREAFWRSHLELNFNPYLAPDDEHIKEMVQMGNGGEMQFADCIINVCWFLDGDSTLAFIVTDLNGKVLYELLNEDCKKTYIWNRE